MANQTSLKFHPDLLNKDAKELARRHTFTHQDKDILPVRPQLNEAKEELTEAYRTLATSVKQNKDITPAAEWLIDNFYIIQEQIVQVENDFPIGFQRNIPHLSSGSNKGMPRVYGLVQNLVVHTDGKVDIENITRYTQSYQEELPLKVGELWAIPIMVRFVLIRQLAIKANRVLKRRDIRTDIQEFITSLLEEDSDEPGWVLRRVIDWMDTRTDSYDERLLYVELAHQLQGAGLISEEEKKWFKYQLQSFGTTLDEALRDEAQRQSKLQVSIRNAVVSMREVSETEWQDFVEECSIVDQILRLDPMGSFTEIDSGTKDQYRSTIERLARRSEYSEKEVAEEVLLLTERHADSSTQNTNDIFQDYSVLKKHVGYYLLGEGYDELTQRIEYNMPLSERIRGKLEETAGYYISFITAFTLLLLAILWVATDAISSSIFVSISVLLVGFFPALELSISAINRFFVFWLPPRILPKMEIEENIPDRDRTMVVVPTLVSSPEDVERQLEKLEITSLANPDPGLQFVLLSDFADADQEKMPGDKAILEKAKNMVDVLNKKYSSRYGDKFFVLHRRRKWNPSEEKWMGWERKRGKLEQLNKLFCNSSEDPSFTYIFGDFVDSIKETPVRFVLTLDADTRTPPESVIDLVRVASHPLNRAWYNEEKDRITKGYGIIQPRISIAPDAANKSTFARIFSGNVGIDPYTTAVSDIYQDLFGEGIYTGKGIYDVRAFHTVLNDRFPENRILSHDLIESNYVRAALSTDIELFDEYPTNYASYCKRNHRWTRGDWQIASWIFGKAPGPEENKENPINLLSRWKIFDNLRRSLNPLFLSFIFVAGWFWLPGSALIWTLAAFGILAFPIYVSFSTDIMNRPTRIQWKLYFEKVRSNLKINTIQAVSTLAVLPHQAMLHLDAIGRTLWRLHVSNKQLLEWTSASQAEKMSSNNLSSYFRSMWVSVVLGAGVLLTAILINPTDLLIVIPFSLLWMSSPYFAWYFSAVDRKKKSELSEDDEITLRTYVRRTWFYFERLVNEEYSWLPPDNDQEDPSLPPVARTSPTNIGLTLVSTLAAYEMGYITISEFLTRLEKTLTSLVQLDRYKGHFYNWYEIRLGEVLSPKYVSTVDSGNLAAGLIVIKQAVNQLMEKDNPNSAFWDGLRDTIETLRSIMDEVNAEADNSDQLCTEVGTCLDRISDKLNGDPPTTISGSLNLLDELKVFARNLCGRNIMQLRSSLGDERVDDLLYWLESPFRQIKSYRDELKQFKNSPLDDALQVSPKQRLNNVQQSVKNTGGYKLLKRWEDQIRSISKISERLVSDMDFSFLYNKKRGLFSIGYNVEKAELDEGTYDLLASEARIASIIAIAKGDVSSEHWFRLGRRLTSRNGHEFLLSWGGTTFEYLMPHLFTRSYPNTLLNHTYGHIVDLQREYAEKFDRPWGFSESAYNSLNMDLNYQYRAFGVPGLGLKRGLAEEFVVAPYASVLSLMTDPKASLNNLDELKQIGALGLKGFYDAVDFTPDHLAESEPYKVVKTYMAHHNGMSLLALLNVLNDWSVQHYFHSDPKIKACELLLQERIPRGIPVKEPYPIDVEMEPGEQHSITYTVDHAGIKDLDNTPPRVHLLSNGSFHSFVSHAGTGSSRYENTRLTGWKSDPTEDPLGQFIYIKDRETGEFWSAFHQPVKRKPDRYDTWFHNGKIQTSRVDEWIETTTEICVSPENPIELRKITLTNYAEQERSLELTSYAEIVLNGPEDHKSHPAFSKLFVQTDYLPEHHGILAWRRPRSADEDAKWMVHMVASHDLENLTEPLQFETERSNFIGRGRSLMNPQAMDSNYKLSGSIGNVLDPILSLRRMVTLKPGEKIEITFGTGWADSREEAEDLADRFDNPHAVERAFELSSIYNTVELEHIGISGDRYQYFQKLAGYMLYNDSRFRAESEVLLRNRRQQSGLWSYGISGDNPIIVFRIRQSDQLKSLKKLLKGHLFWKHRGLQTDLVIINDHPPSYADELQEGIQQAVEASHSSHQGHGEGDVFVLRSDRLSDEDLTLVLTVASIVLRGTLPEINVFNNSDEEVSSFEKGGKTKTYKQAEIGEEVTKKNIADEEALQFFNGYGGFSDDGSEYRIIIRIDSENETARLPPAPWVNIIANSSFGFLATESGAGYTWSQNSRENKLTSWSNDPVLDPSAEAFYIRDEENKRYWSPTPGPVPGQNSYEISHGFGYTRYEHTSYSLKSELVQFVPKDDPVKISRLKIRNRSNRKRRISVFSYHEWVLGINREDSAPFIIQEADENSDAIYTRNYYNNEFSDRIAFASCAGVSKKGAEVSFTTDRQFFIGRNCSLEKPEAVADREKLDEEVNTGGDPCAAFQIVLVLEPGEEIECSILMGETANRNKAEKLVQEYQKHEQVEEAFHEITEFWRERLTRIQVETPDSSLNRIMNGWLMYQNIACRMLSRTGFYQAGGAFGFRDQLQDAMAALYVDPQMTRGQILLHASRQFPEGDVQHWWHPPTGRGVRSKITDDRLWLPYVVDFYIESTGDKDILEERVPYLEARKLEEHEHEVYLQPQESNKKGSLYEHCIRAIDVTMETGEHGLPLIGTGDWNDGMNRVGAQGKGESVWLGFFLHIILQKFAKYSKKRGDKERAERYEEEAQRLAKHLNKEGWDGEWYIRAFYDDGSPLGSAQNDEGRIDAISQSWSVISGVAPKKKRHQALAALEKHLVSKEDRLIRLLTPPFDQTDQNPGYIKGYIPGVRENGGQYTHAAVWAIKAFAESGFGNKAVECLHMINPVNHALNPEQVAKYKVEPYVVAADVYGEPPLTGRGGWTWYTGSAGWMYRVALESILGIRIKEHTLIIQPVISSEWDSYNIEWRMNDGKTVYHMEISNPDELQSGGLEGTVDGEPVSFPNGKAKIRLKSDGQEHSIKLQLIR
ncbi:GH36-type glycosyl hydrolase domain-containing protein [Fodinibius sp. AD559]|uniref:GH36-type glycosyl hydrolase domain-containing protein n=1 Tax=Fodinibius sp. AD559 TaxID=3424179 RepID=UPI004046BCB8